MRFVIGLFLLILFLAGIVRLSESDFLRSMIVILFVGTGVIGLTAGTLMFLFKQLGDMAHSERPFTLVAYLFRAIVAMIFCAVCVSLLLWAGLYVLLPKD